MKTLNQFLPRTAWFVARLAAGISLLAAVSPAVFAQDSSGNALLNGAFRFRYVATLATSSTGVVTETTAAEGVIQFGGNGTYTISAGSQWLDNTVSSGRFQTIPTGSGGTYGISPAGIGFITVPNPNSNLSGDVLFGTFSQGVFTASSTEYGVNDLFVAIAVGTIPTTASFTSAYNISVLDFAIGTDVDVKNVLFKITPDGKGNLGTLNLQGWANSQNGTFLTQSATGATYSFASDGGATLTVPAPTGVATPQVLFSGSRIMYVSSDGNFVLGWNPSGYDIFFGVKALAVTGTDTLFSGLYYLSGMGDQPTTGGQQLCGPFSFWGSENADGNQNQVVHQRLYWPTCANFTDGNGFPLPYDFGTWDLTGISSDGSASDLPLGFLYPDGSLYEFGNGGNAYVAISATPGTFGLTIGIHAPSFTPSGVFLSPIGVVHAASWSPITASVAPGELITLFGSNLAPTTLISTGGQPFPNSLGNVQVLINGTLAPIYYVSPTQLSVIAPYELANATTYTVEIQVNNGGLLSNQISVYLHSYGDANSGIFSDGPNDNGNPDGIGGAVAEHADGSLITTNSPAQPGETIVLALSGMGTVTPSITDGAVPSTSTLSYVDDFTAGLLTVFFHDYDNNQYFQQATIGFAGLYPGLAGLYQMNVVVPTTVGPGNDIFIELVTPFADGSQVQIPVGGSANAAAARTAISTLDPRGVPTLIPRPSSPRSVPAGVFGPRPAGQRPAPRVSTLPRRMPLPVVHPN